MNGFGQRCCLIFPCRQPLPIGFLTAAEWIILEREKSAQRRSVSWKVPTAVILCLGIMRISPFFLMWMDKPSCSGFVSGMGKRWRSCFVTDGFPWKKPIFMPIRLRTKQISNFEMCKMHLFQNRGVFLYMQENMEKCRETGVFSASGCAKAPRKIEYVCKMMEFFRGVVRLLRTFVYCFFFWNW